MTRLWFGIAAVMAALYVVFDGFDFGAGLLHLIVARDDRERRQVLNAIGPFWDGNEVWLLALGGVLFLAFPKVLGSALSGFYLAIFLVIWVLILRGIAIEFRSHVGDRMWRAFWDAVFALASTLAPILFGAALGNVIRGVPLDADGYFRLPLWTDFRVGPTPGVLDWYTVIAGVMALVAVAHHGALFLAWRTDGGVRARSRRAASLLFVPLGAIWIGATVATASITPGLYANLAARPLAWITTLVAFAGYLTAFLAGRRGRDLLAFLGSSAFLVGLLAATAVCVYPTLLRSSLEPAMSLTSDNAASSGHALRTGLMWWPVAFVFVVAYFSLLFRLHRGRVVTPREGEGY
jgi:cytochrome d ubiquinol oxidase subunit II